MLTIIGRVLKITLFSIGILILGNWIMWDGKTISDQIKIQVSHAQRSNITSKVRQWTENLARQAKNRLNINLSPSPDNSDEEEISPSERQKLKSLIRELNRTKK